MNSDLTAVPTRTAGHPLLRILASFPIACFSGALITDIVYATTSDIVWADFSTWLLAGGMVFGVLAAVVGLVDLVSNQRLRRPRSVPVAVIGSLLVLGIGFLNNLVHSRDAWTSVVPEGLALSAITVVLILLTVWFSSGTVYRNRIVVQPSGFRP